MGKIDIEQVKLVHDHTKNMTTLSTGSIVVLVTFFDKLTENPTWTLLIAISLGAFVVSILGALAAQIAFVDLADPDEKGYDSWHYRAGAVALVTSWLAFVLAVVCLCVFGVRNIV
ncbi:MAG: hypothetical protein EP322_03355 [Bacteroidetes bacterium]|nr:MAG: hypothetical protein EP322_03355 [Bacteroidota bacterium]